MGLRMDIHNPSVPAAATNQVDTNGIVTRESLMELMRQKDALESELEALGSVLESHGVNMNTSLTTFDGFPRDDIDVAQIRITRARIIHLRNDHKALMSKIEKGLHEFHAAHLEPAQDDSNMEEEKPSASTSEPTRSRADQPTTLPETVFARVNSVVTNSPADVAGLKAGDGIIRFGDVDFMNHASLRQVSTLVQNSQGREILVKVQRTVGHGGATESLELTLVPRANWGGRGLLGCHLLPA